MLSVSVMSLSAMSQQPYEQSTYFCFNHLFLHIRIVVTSPSDTVCKCMRNELQLFNLRVNINRLPSVLSRDDYAYFFSFMPCLEFSSVKACRSAVRVNLRKCIIFISVIWSKSTFPENLAVFASSRCRIWFVCVRRAAIQPMTDL